MVELVFADEVNQAHRYCATIGRAKLENFYKRRFVPEHTDDTATVTFIKFEYHTYAVTAAHVIEAFASQADAEGVEYESYFLPTGKGISMNPTFISPPADWPDKAPDIALRKIDSRLPGYIGKEAFSLLPESMPTFPIPYAAAVGFPTLEKAKGHRPDGEHLFMPCVHAIAEGVGSSEFSDQVQFYSELPDRLEISSLSGMSGGPVFWSDNERFGLIGFVKQALDINPRDGEESIHAGPRVNFICQRASYENFRRWVEYVELETPRRMEALNQWASKTRSSKQTSGN